MLRLQSNLVGHSSNIIFYRLFSWNSLIFLSIYRLLGDVNVKCAIGESQAPAVAYRTYPPTLIRLQEEDNAGLAHIPYYDHFELLHSKTVNREEVAYNGIVQSVGEQLAANETGRIIIGIKDFPPEGSQHSFPLSHLLNQPPDDLDKKTFFFEESLEGNGTIKSMRVLPKVGLVIMEFDPKAALTDVQTVVRNTWNDRQKVWLIEADTKVDLRDNPRMSSLSNFSLNTSTLNDFDPSIVTQVNSADKLRGIITRELLRWLSTKNTMTSVNRLIPFSFVNPFVSMFNNPVSTAMTNLFTGFLPFSNSRAREYPNDPNFPLQWGLSNVPSMQLDIKAPGAWNLIKGTALKQNEVVVAHIDTGIDHSHPDLAPNIWTNPNEIPNNGIDDDGNGYIDDVHGWNFRDNNALAYDSRGHGTHTAGTIGAIGDNGIGVAGVIWNVKLMPLKFLDRVSGAVEAIDYSIRMGAHISTNSWGYNSFSSSLLRALQKTREHGQLFVCAVDNKGRDNTNFSDFPPNFNNPNMINVAALAATGDLDVTSNYGKENVHIAAPGKNIFSTVLNGRYDFKDGTSTATPFVAGVAALLLSYFPRLTAYDLRKIILASANRLPTLNMKVVSGGTLDALEAFKLALQESLD